MMAVRANHTVTTPSGRTLTATDTVTLIPATAWHRMRTGSGAKGIRHYDWAMLAIAADDTGDLRHEGHSVLLLRRHRYIRTLSFYRCWSPQPIPLSELIAVAIIRWRIEEDHQLAKQSCGLDTGQVTRWRSWHRWTAICLLAYIYLAIATVLPNSGQCTGFSARW
jgi:SRSO17 transposase